MIETRRPRAAPEIVARPLHGSGEFITTWIVGDPGIDRYLVVPSAVLRPVEHAIRCMDGSRTVEEVEQSVRTECQARIDVTELLVRLKRAGLLDGSERPDAEDMERLSLQLARIPLGTLTRAGKWLGPAPAKPLLLVASLIAVAPAAIWGYSPADLAPAHAPSSAQVLLALAFAVLLHEAAHAAVAVREGLRPERLTVALYLGLLPIAYLRIPGIYSLPRWGRIRVWSAGLLMNLGLAVFAGGIARGLAGSAAANGWAVFSAWNLGLVVVNLLPFLPTDGYFLYSTLTGEHNLRKRAWIAVRSAVRGRLESMSAALAAYTLTLIGMLAWSLFRLIHHLRAEWLLQHRIDVRSLLVLGFLLGCLAGYPRYFASRIAPRWNRLLFRSVRPPSRAVAADRVGP